MHIPAVAKLLILDDEAAQMTALCHTLEHEDDGMMLNFQVM